MLSFGNKLNIIKSKPTGPFCTFSTSAAQRVTVKSRSRAEEQICVGVQTTSAPGRGDCPRGQPGTCPRFETVIRSRQGHGAHPTWGIWRDGVGRWGKTKGKTMYRQQLRESVAPKTTTQSSEGWEGCRWAEREGESILGGETPWAKTLRQELACKWVSVHPRAFVQGAGRTHKRCPCLHWKVEREWIGQIIFLSLAECGLKFCVESIFQTTTSF